ncbi:hypothetical protein OG369_23420 [Streptomyces sp. NBC_01221]|uniref:MFS transporter n=1 Tax=unclassified Streptomyces TaxID=2593676 RepID=UPI002255611B|nr:MFS transporter [Streptomyces sp. NBC_01221]MCX4789024.1 hypothetical protein [Streptomyces sp. NBC_01221]WSP57212.1 hypothetical protein OG306_24655 [Streptomyces sp. NBC_01241]WSU22070.1 hypothetical protein OG508_14575 [Streptomyces sp. NBC_01108]
MSPASQTRSPTAGTWLLSFFFLGSAAEMLQAVALLWATYELTHNAVVVGAIGAAAHLPGVVLGLALRKKADAGQAARLLSLTNWVLFAGSSALALVWAAGLGPGVIIGAFAAVQCSLSVVKTLNKAYVGRFVRQHFAPTHAVRLLARSSALSLVGALIGGGASGLLLDTTAADSCFAVAALLYLLSLVAVRLVTAAPPAVREVPDSASPPAAPAARTVARAETPRAEPADPAGRTRLILLYSIPSSGALPFISTLMVPLAQSVAPGSGSFYSVLTVTTAFGGFLAGMALSRGTLSAERTLNIALVAGGALVACFAATRWPPAVLLLMLVAAVVLTAHVMVMQVLTNQAPPADQVGRFSVVRNSVAGSAKAGFSLLAGWLVEAWGLGTAWLVLAVVLALFGCAWWSVKERSSIEELARVG